MHALILEIHNNIANCKLLERRKEMAATRSRRSDGAIPQKSVLSKLILMMIVSTVCMMEQGVMAEDQQEAVEARNLTMIKIKAHNLYPEGFDWDSKHNRFLVGSMGEGRLVTVTEEGIVEEFVKDAEYAGASILGVTVDSIRNRVLAVVHKHTDPQMAALAAYDLDSKTRTLFVNLLEEGDLVGKTVVANDVAVDDDGNAYVTNSAGNLIWKVSQEGVKNVFVASVPQLPIAVEDEFVKTCTSNGIVHQDGYLLVSQSNSGALLRVSIANKEAKPVEIKDKIVMPGSDGVTLRPDGSLVVLSTHTAWLLSSRDSWQSATLVDTVPLDEGSCTTSGAIQNMRVFTLHSYFSDYYRGADRDSFTILEITFSADDSLDDSPLWLLVIVGIFALGVLLWKFQMDRFNKAYTKKRI